MMKLLLDIWFKKRLNCHFCSCRVYAALTTDQPRVQSWLGSPWETPSNYVWGTHQGFRMIFFPFPMLHSITSCCCKVWQAKLRQQLLSGSSPAHFSGRKGELGAAGFFTLASSPPRHGQSSLSHWGLPHRTALCPGSSARNLPFGTADIQCQVKVVLWVC